MIVITGAAGFIGSCLVRALNDRGHKDLILVDEFSRDDKLKNLKGKAYTERLDREAFLPWLRGEHPPLEAIFHLGARTDTTEQDKAVFDHLNLNYSKAVWASCAAQGIPLIYASSAATYGLGEQGYSDKHEVVHDLKPLNPYGESKNEFDKWALAQNASPPYWVGLKFFNVYGPNEYHKGRMASVIFHTARQIRETGAMRLFRSHRPDVEDGQQKRDFIYVKDVVEVCYFFFSRATRPHPDATESGLYNLGTGEARSFWDLATLTFRALDKQPDITFIDTPADIRDTYQYFTRAEMEKLRELGYGKSFLSLEEGIEDYVRNYLASEKIW